MRWLLEARPFARQFALPPREQSCPLKYSPNAGWADSHNVGVQHHECQSTIAFQRVLQVKVDDCLLLPPLQPKITRDPTVVLVDATVALSPIVELAGAHAQPVDEPPNADLRF